MKTDNTSNFIIKRIRLTILVGVFAILAAVVAVPLRSVRSSSLGTHHRSDSVVADLTRPQVGTRSLLASKPVDLENSSSLFQPLPFATEGIATFNSDCLTPQSDFFLGDVVCAKASGVPT